MMSQGPRRQHAANLTRRRFLSGAAGAAAVVGAPAFARSQPASAGKPLKEITVGEISRSGTGWARVIAAGKGFFADEGLAVHSLIIQGGPPGIVRQVVGGSLDIGVSNFDIIIRGIQGGGPITMIGSSMIKFALSVVSAPGIKSAADLKGKTVSVSSPKDPTALFLNRWLRQNGMLPSDVDVIYVAATQDRFAALLSGTVAAVALTQPFDFRALDRGFNRLIDYGQMAGDNTVSWLSRSGNNGCKAIRRRRAASCARSSAAATGCTIPPTRKRRSICWPLTSSRTKPWSPRCTIIIWSI